MFDRVNNSRFLWTTSSLFDERIYANLQVRRDCDDNQLDSNEAQTDSEDLKSAESVPKQPRIHFDSNPVTKLYQPEGILKWPVIRSSGTKRRVDPLHLSAYFKIIGLVKDPGLDNKGVCWYLAGHKVPEGIKKIRQIISGRGMIHHKLHAISMILKERHDESNWVASLFGLRSDATKQVYQAIYDVLPTEYKQYKCAGLLFI